MSDSNPSPSEMPSSSQHSVSAVRRHRGKLIAGAIGLLALLVIYGSVSWAFSSKLIAQQFPSEEQVDFASFGLPNPEVFTVTNDKIDLAGWYFDNPADAGCGVVMLHGYTGNKATVLNVNPLF